MRPEAPPRVPLASAESVASCGLFLQSGGMRRVLSVLAAVGWLAVAATGQAQDREEEARALFMAGRAAYDGGRYEAALERFQEAYELSGRPELLYNIGQTADRLRQDAVALDAFRRFLADTPEDTAHRDMAERRVAFLERSVGPAQAPDPAEPDEQEPEEPGTDVTAPDLDPATMDAEDLALDTSEPEPAPTEDSGGIATKWWFWTILAVVVVGAGVGIGLAVAGDDGDPQYAVSDHGSVIEALGVFR